MQGTLFIIGIGPGGSEHITPAARNAVARVSDVVAYPLYLDLLGDLIADKQRHDSPLGDEIGRARRSLELAAAGKSTALISSGDAGIYAMATLVFELLEREGAAEWHQINIEIIPGISALQAAASRAGAPLAHDFCTISLSDLLTPWPTIETRIRAAGLGDFVIAFYNPVSQKRTWQLARARELLLEYRPRDTPVIVARNVTRPTEKINLTTLGELNPADVDMLTVVLVGSTETRRFGDWIYTPRGYAQKLEYTS